MTQQVATLQEVEEYYLLEDVVTVNQALDEVARATRWAQEKAQRQTRKR